MASLRKSRVQELLDDIIQDKNPPGIQETFMTGGPDEKQKILEDRGISIDDLIWAADELDIESQYPAPEGVVYWA